MNHAKQPLRYDSIESPVGEILLIGDGHALHGLYMQQGRTSRSVEPHWKHDPDALAEARRQVREYFCGQRVRFELDLVLDGTAFQRRVWQGLLDITYNQTLSYGELARRIGQPSAVRAVGAANGCNPISIIVPCHRVIGADGSLVGYGGGLERKRHLLDLEAETSAKGGLLT
jgi:methylated-DNA-[protein]-cysteine S-methyltransferase